MKRLMIFLAAGLLAGPAIGNGAQTAQARLFCWSARFQQGSYFGGWYTLDLTTFDPQNTPPNGELGPLLQNYIHWCNFIETDNLLDETLPGIMNLNIPSLDANNNGFDDFFEVSQSVSGTTSGIYNDDYGGGGTVSASWSRSAGSKSGTCVLTLTDSYLGQLGSFTHTFEIYDYAGTLSYTPASNTVPASLNVSEIVNPANFFKGPMAFTKSAANRFNLLLLQPHLPDQRRRADSDRPHQLILPGQYMADQLLWLRGVPGWRPQHRGRGLLPVDALH